MSMQKFGSAGDGTPVEEIALSLPSGACASIITFGAIVRDLQVPMPDGSVRRVVLGFRDLAGYLADIAYVGATVGRSANRIAHGRFRLDGTEYQLACNEGGRHHVHGGLHGFSRRVWSIVDHDTSSVTLALTSAAGDEGYPGAVSVRCRYVLLEPATLRVELTAATDAPTLMNLAHHSYFTFDYGRSIGDHRLQVNASAYTVFDGEQIPTGEVRSVAGTRYDFRKPKPVSDPAETSLLDMNFVLDRAGGELALAAVVEASDHSLRMEVHTTEPGMQVYDGSHLRPSHPGLDGHPHFPNAGLCLEPQKFPDAINHQGFPSPVLRPEERYSQITEYRLTPRDRSRDR
jgi:aldose 1-epimerase